MLSVFVSSLASLLSIIALISSNKHENETLAWGVARGKSLVSGYYNVENYFLGVTGVRIRENYHGTYTHSVVMYDSDECSADFCSDCTDAFRTVIGFTALFFIFTVFSTALNCVRRLYLNSNLVRSATTATSVLSILWGLIALNTFSSKCFAKFIDEVGIEKNTHHFYGGGFAVLATAICLVFIDIVINWVVIPLGDKSEYEQPPQQKEAELQTQGTTAPPPVAANSV